MDYQGIAKVRTKSRRKNKGFVISGYTASVKGNLKSQQAEYRRLTGKNIPLASLAAILLKDAKLNPESI